MEHQFWLERWEQDQIGFHQQEINRYLMEHWEELGLPDGAPVFVPLCGKSLDMLWLRSLGHPVCGVELSRKALDAFTSENDLTVERNEGERFSEYRGENLTLLCGDYFTLRREDLGAIQAVFDRASLIALPPSMRPDYVRHMATLLGPGGHILLVTMEYPAGAIDGPPFSVEEAEVESLYGEAFEVERQGVFEAAGPRGVAVTEKLYRITRKS